MLPTTRTGSGGRFFCALRICRRRRRAASRANKAAKGRSQKGGGLDEYQRCSNQLRNDTSAEPFLFAELHLVQTGIDAAQSEQLFVLAALDHASILHDDDEIGVLD